MRQRGNFSINFFLHTFYAAFIDIWPDFYGNIIHNSQRATNLSRRTPNPMYSSIKRLPAVWTTVLRSVGKSSVNLSASEISLQRISTASYTVKEWRTLRSIPKTRA